MALIGIRNSKVCYPRVAPNPLREGIHGSDVIFMVLQPLACPMRLSMQGSYA